MKEANKEIQENQRETRERKKRNNTSKNKFMKVLVTKSWTIPLETGKRRW
jgi:flagellar hook assembly protein FlgD